MAGYKKRGELLGPNIITQTEHFNEVGAKAVTAGMITVGTVIAADTSAAGVLVSRGAILRIEVAADTYVAFGESNIGAVTSSTSPAAKLTSGWWYVRATADYVRTSANPARIEIMNFES